MQALQGPDRPIREISPFIYTEQRSERLGRDFCGLRAPKNWLLETYSTRYDVDFLLPPNKITFTVTTSPHSSNVAT